MSDLLSVDDAARLCEVTRQTVSRRIDRGSIQAVRRDGRRYVPRSELVRVGLLRPEGSEEVEQLRAQLAAAQVELRELRALPAQLHTEQENAARLEAAIHAERAARTAAERAAQEADAARTAAERTAAEALARASAPLAELILSRLRTRFRRSMPETAAS